MYICENGIIHIIVVLYIGVPSALDHFQKEHFMNLRGASIVSMIFKFCLLHAVAIVVSLLIDFENE